MMFVGTLVRVNVGMHATEHVWRSEDNPSAGDLVCHFVWGWVSSFLLCFKTSWPTSFQGLCCYCIPSPHRSTGTTDAFTHLQLDVGSGDSDSGPRACSASPLLTDPSLCSYTLFLLVFPDSLLSLSLATPIPTASFCLQNSFHFCDTCSIPHTHFLKIFFLPFMIPFLVSWPIIWIHKN